MTLPENMKVLHDCDFTHDYLQQYTDEIYFRMKHDLINLHSPSLPGGFSLCNITLAEYAMHINGCYADISMTENEIRSYSMHPVYSPELWLAVKNDKTGEIAATGIAELDAETGEGILEWIQVSEAYRGCGLGTYIVTELLCRIAKKAKFATVSGQVQNPSNPEALYRKCGFTGNDIWHILRKKHSSDEMTCFCGHDCSRCVTYLATAGDDDELRRQSKQFYENFFNRDISLCDFNCYGGRSGTVFSLCQECPFSKCCREKNIHSCNECEKQCEMFKDYQKKYVNKYNQL